MFSVVPLLQGTTPLNFQLSQHSKSVTLLPVIQCCTGLGNTLSGKRRKFNSLTWCTSVSLVSAYFPRLSGIFLCMHRFVVSQGFGHFLLGFGSQLLCSFLASKIFLLNFKLSSNPELFSSTTSIQEGQHFPPPAVENPQTRKSQTPNSNPL